MPPLTLSRLRSTVTGIAALAITSVMLPIVAGPVLADGAPVPRRLDRDRRVDCVNTERFERWAEAERQALPDRPVAPRPHAPPADPNVGDSWDWYIWDLAGFPSANLESCTVRGEGPNVYVVVRDADWNVFVDQEDIDIVLDHFENRSYGLDPARGIYPLSTEAFGDPPLGLDNDPKVYLLYYDFTIRSDGFAGWADSEPDQGVGLNKSNECEVLYLNCGPDAGVDHDPGGNYMLSVIAHEFEHVIHAGIDPDEENWLDESMAEIGMYLFNPTAEFTAAFQANPDIELTLDNPGGSYGCRFFWAMHVYDQHGGVETIREIIATQENGIVGFDTAFGNLGRPETFEDVFTSWVAANRLDDPRIDGGLYDYPNYDAAFSPSRTHGLLPVVSDFGDVARWAADHVVFSNLPPGQLRVSFDGSDTSAFSVQVVLEDSTGAGLPRVEPMALDADSAGALTVAPGAEHDTAILVVGAVDPTTARATYQYSATTVEPIDLRVAKHPVLDTVPVLTWTTGSPPPYVVNRGDAPTVRLMPTDEFRNLSSAEYTDLIPVTTDLVCYTVDVQ